ncbi:Molybdenum cofactor biosynthesis protein MoaA [Candidatus Paraburkholderia calva]|nr:Molybdenum cofactor biosynthesis protein MoaA [Candidatus Paraburkholderia calva]
MNDADFAVADVLNGIETAQAIGLDPVKINMVVKRGTNDQEIVPLARHFKGSGAILRFIEYMDVGASNGWNMSEVLPSAQVVELIDAHFSLVPSPFRRRNRVALGLSGRRRRNRGDFERNARLLRRRQARAAVHGRQALSLPVRQRRTRSARTDPWRRER